jgi:CRP/FNR family transcriptional regulator
MDMFTPEAGDNQFASVEQIERWPAGEVIFREGEEPRGIFILYSGRVDLVFSGRNGVKKSLRTALPGEIVGLSDAVSGTPYDCTATTRTGVKVGFVPIDAFRRLVEQSPTVWLTIARHLSVGLESCWSSMRAIVAAR